MGTSRDSTRTEDLTPLVMVLAVASWLTAFALFAFWRVGMDRSDFFLFVASGQAWLDGSNMYPLDQNPNLNPPTAVAVLFAPLARLPYVVAQILWTVCGAAALVGSLRTAAKELRLTRVQVLWILGITNITHAAFLIWMQGQLTWLLMYPVQGHGSRCVIGNMLVLACGWRQQSRSSRFSLCCRWSFPGACG